VLFKLGVAYAECRKATQYAGCHFAECHYTECRGATFAATVLFPFCKLPLLVFTTTPKNGLLLVLSHFISQAHLSHAVSSIMAFHSSVILSKSRFINWSFLMII
jgi:hypothetical protein